jgi:hypothetical protein
MTQSRAFSDSEIVTIAAVAAAALGGIVVGLGRGQENAGDQLAASATARSVGQRAIDAGKSIAYAPTADTLDGSRSQIASAAQSMVREARPIADDLLRRASSALPLDDNSAVSKVRQKPIQSISKSISTALSKTISDVVERVGPASQTDAKQQLNDLPGIAKEFVSNLLPSSENGLSSSSMPAAGVVNRVAQELASFEQGLEATPDRVRSGSKRSKAVLQERIADPVTTAAGSTGSAMKESIAALAWLSAGAAIVYFGMLSDERREQVKDALCGAMEQVRLLALDLQGYEPEL